jgi:pyruvate,orthophosphate dikinase
LRIAHDLVEEGLISPAEALARIDGIDLDAVENVTLNVAGHVPVARGTPASAGVAIGVAVFDPERVAALKQKGKPVVLFRENAETSDIGALSEAAALVTAEGARTSHAAVVARELGKVCIVGCEGLAMDPSGRKGAFGPQVIEEGEVLSVDGVKGEIYRGEIEVVRTRPTELLSKIAQWSTKKSSATEPVLAGLRIHR